MAKVIVFKTEAQAIGHDSLWRFKGVIEDPYKPTPAELGKRFGAGTFLVINYDNFNPFAIKETKSYEEVTTEDA